MSMRIARAIRIVCFLLIFVFIFVGVQFIFQNKLAFDTNSYARIKLFYKEENAPEVVFIGPSTTYYNINPLVIFKEHGIASYDFSPPYTSSAAVTLYVKEAIETYDPKIVAIDAGNFYNPYVTEAATRSWLDPMPLSAEKIKTVLEVKKDLKNMDDYGEEFYSTGTYIFPLLRYHDRWVDLKPEDFVKDPLSQFYHGAKHYHGYGPRFYHGTVNFDSFKNPIDLPENAVLNLKKNFDNTIKICKQNNTEVILYKSPEPYWRQGYHDLIEAWALEHGVTFLDCNYMMDELEIDLDRDFESIIHLSDSGATKFSRYLGNYLAERYELPDHRRDPDYASWENDWEIYQHDRAAYSLASDWNWTSYMEKLKNPDYTVIMSACDSIGGDVHPELTSQLLTLGVSPEAQVAGQKSYIAVIDGGAVIYERLSDEELTHELKLNGHFISVESKSILVGNSASIEFDGEERCLNRRGINILVYDCVLDGVIDCVTFDLFAGGTPYR